MKRTIAILATALFASGLLTAAADARGGGGGGHGGGFGGGAHIGGFGGEHMGGPAVSGLGRVDGGHIGFGDHHAMHRFGPRYGIYDNYDPYCYYSAEAPKIPPWPPFCS